MKKPIQIFHILSILLLHHWVLAQDPEFVKQINTVGLGEPGGLCRVGNIVYFRHNDNIHGIELWRTDGTAQGTYMVKDLNPGLGDGVRGDLNQVAFNGLLYFSGYSPIYGEELWKTDGTEIGTVLVKDINPGTSNSFISKFTVSGNTFFFTAFTPSFGAELWKSNGTTSGTSIVNDITPGSTSSSITEIIACSDLQYDYVFFTVNSPSYQGLWYTVGLGTNPTRIGSTEGVSNLFFNSRIAPNTDYIFDIYFKRPNGAIGKYNINSNYTSDIANVANSAYQPFSVFGNLNGYLYFSGYTSMYGQELWQSQGTDDDTYHFANINNSPTNGNSNPYGFTYCNNALYFSAYSSTTGRELWKTDGTVAGTILIADIVAGSSDSNPYNLKAIGNKLYFMMYEPSNFITKLYCYDTSTSSLTLLQTYPYPIYTNFEELNGQLIFAGYDTTDGYEIYKTDGTVAGTSKIKNISLGESFPSDYFSLGSKTLFTASASTGLNPRTPFVTDGTTAGTFPISTINLPFSFNPVFVGINPSTVFFSDDSKIYKTNGTVAGTVEVKNINPSGYAYITEMYNANGTLYFSADDGILGSELWKSDGTTAGTVQVADIDLGNGSSYPRGFVYYNGYTYFFATPNSSTYNFYRTDGQTVTLVSSGINSVGSPIVFNNKILFCSQAPEELWSSDGTTTTLLKDIRTVDNIGAYPRNFTTNGIVCYFTADDGVNGRELWKTDGTAAGTVMVKDIHTGAQGSDPQNMVLAGNLLLFSANTSTTGRELYRSDGTQINTFLVKDIYLGVNSGISSTNSKPFGIIGPHIFFSATNGINGYELWKSNGTLVNLVENIQREIIPNYSTKDGVSPSAQVHTNPGTGRAFFEATNGSIGRGLYSFVFCPPTQNISTTVHTDKQKQQASNLLTSSSNISATDDVFSGVNVQYTSSKAIILEPGFKVESTQLIGSPPVFYFRTGVFEAKIQGCN
ncbi:MAG: ELWxxDGT repeat protein [Leadbetterella sp.]